MTEARQPRVIAGEGILLVEDMGDGYKAPWDWRALPIADGDTAFDRLVSGDTLRIEQHDGRVLRLATFHQYPTHAGMLAGYPQVRNYFIESTIEAARRLFGVAVNPVLLPPRLVRLPDHRSLRPELPTARLPLVTSIGEFHSTPIRDKKAHKSSGIVVWWQESFGLPTEEHILMQLRDLDWMVPAEDWEP